jgi:hypothetical protein
MTTTQHVSEFEGTVYDPRRGLHVTGPAKISWERGGFWPWSAPLGVCAVCRVKTEALFELSTAEHHITNRSGDPAKALGCSNCWEFYLREDDAAQPAA